MAVGIVAFMNGRLEWMLVVLFLIATQSAFFSPAKYGIVPEIVPERALSRANGLARDEHVCRDRPRLGRRHRALRAVGRAPADDRPGLDRRGRRRRRGEHRHPARLAGARCRAAALEPVVGPVGRRPAPDERAHAVDDRARRGVVLVPRRAAADGRARGRAPGDGPERWRDCRDERLPGRGRRRRQPRRRPVVGRQGRTRPGAVWRLRHGRRRPRAGLGDAVVSAGLRGAAGAGICRRPVHRAAPRAASAEAGGGREGVGVCRQQPAEHGGDPAGQRVDVVPRSCRRRRARPRHPGLRRVSTRRQRLRAVAAAGLLPSLLAASAHAHALSRRGRRASNTCRRAARRCWCAITCRTSTASWSARACSASSGSWSTGRTSTCRWRIGC